RPRRKIACPRDRLGNEAADIEGASTSGDARGRYHNPARKPPRRRWLPVVWTLFRAKGDGWIASEVLHGKPPQSVLERCASLDDAGRRDGPTIGRLPEGHPDERVRCAKAISSSRGTSPAQMSRLRSGRTG